MNETVNILLVDDQPGKLLSYEVILQELGENLIKASNAKEALECLLRHEVAVILMDVCMPDLDGFELMSMIREHPRYQNTAVIFISAIHLTDLDRVRGYEMGAVDYVPVPVIPEVLRAKVKVFAELFRKTRQLEFLNAELERRVAERTAALEASTYRLMKSEQRRNLALAATNLGAWDWDCSSGDWHWDEGQFRIFGVDRSFVLTADSVERLIFPEDRAQVRQAAEAIFSGTASCEVEFRVQRPDGHLRYCVGTAAATFDEKNAVVRVSGVTADVTERKEAEERQMLLAREVDHRGKNALALVQAIIKMTRASDLNSYIESVEGRIKALARVHTVLSLSRWRGADLAGLVKEELAPYQTAGSERISIGGPAISMQPTTAQTIALVLHELATNAAKYGALSSKGGSVSLTWDIKDGGLTIQWKESGGPATLTPTRKGFGTKIIVNSVEQQLGGKVSLDWQPEGLRCTLFAPRYDKLEQTGHARIARSEDADESARASQLEVVGNRVMIVEDEALVAMVVSDALGSLGFSVVGPFGSCAEAISSLNHDRIDAAILDVNLGKGLAYPLADLLTELAIPFVFLTGYDSASIERRFNKIPVLAKPVEIQALRNVFARPNAVSDWGSAVQVRAL